MSLELGEEAIEDVRQLTSGLAVGVDPPVGVLAEAARRAVLGIRAEARC